MPVFLFIIILALFLNLCSNTCFCRGIFLDLLLQCWDGTRGLSWAKPWVYH